MGWGRSILFTLLILISFAYAKSNWDWMDCHEGYYVTGPTPGTDHCVCPENWGGIDCGMCLNEKVCKKGDICDKTLIVGDYKSFSCYPSESTVIPIGSVTSQWNFTGGDAAAHGVVSVFIHPLGAPFLFNCSFGQCTKKVDYDSNTFMIACETTSCFCTTWCNALIKPIIDAMSGNVKFYCNLGTNVCTIQQAKLPVVIKLDCTASGCQDTVFVPTPPQYTWTQILLIAISSGVAFSILIAAFVYACIVNRRKDILKPMYQMVSGDLTLSLSWNNVSCQIGKRNVLNGITGIAQPGQILAILGPSGAGKTTFLDILAGRKNTGKVQGEILINGQPRDSKSWKRISGYVLQDERMLGTLTVREHLLTVAYLRLPSDMPNYQKQMKVDEVLEELGISHIADSRIGTSTARGISGGEKKRLAIASELITDPPLLFLDEPTSGLDSYNAYALMETLKKLAQEKKRTIVVSIHQPRSNIFQLFDSLLLLSYGELVYFGPAQESLSHFSSLGYECPRNFNPADYLIDMVTMNSEGLVRTLSQRYKESYLAGNVTTKLNTIQEESTALTLSKDYMGEYATNIFYQFYILSWRTLVNNLRNPYLMRFQYIVTIALAFLIGGLYWKVALDISGVQDRFGCLFFLACLLSFGSMSSIDTFFEERPIFLRERANGMYRTSSYFLSKAFCDVLPMRIIPPILMAIITYPMVQLHSGFDHFLWFALTLVLISLVSGTMCLAISAAIPSLSLGNLIAILLMLFYMLFGGFLLNKDSIPVVLRWMKWLSFLQFGYEVLMVNELNDLDVVFNPTGYSPIEINASQYLVEFNMDPDRFYLDIYVLCAMAVGYSLIAYLLLRFATKEKR